MLIFALHHQSIHTAEQSDKQNVQKGKSSNSHLWNVQFNKTSDSEWEYGREREEGCLHRMHLLIITYITSNDVWVWKALSDPAFHYAQDSITQLRFHIWRVNWSKHNAEIALLISQLWVVLKVQLPPHSVPWLETDAFADLEVIHRVATQMPSCHLRLY